MYSYRAGTTRLCSGRTRRIWSSGRRCGHWQTAWLRNPWPWNVLINNAGAAFTCYEQTTDAVERSYAFNHHAPFLLTHAPVANGVRTLSARIINLSTFVERRGKLDTRDPDVAGTSWNGR
ncbi:hypothetical protein [Streptomyces sp. AA1529]|uniref:hypothetical protein n=1 Tax=Streptomyces sp. AA1529 TaxID=1203257 RepID=UPI003D7418FB